MTDSSEHAALCLDPLLNYEQAAEILGVTERSIWNYVDRGELPCVRFGKSVRIDPADLRAYIDRCKTTSRGGDHDPR